MSDDLNNRRQRADINNLISIISAMTSLIKNNDSKEHNKKLFIEIGKSADRISRNSKNPDNIRNKYGAHQRGFKMKIKEYGIYFEGLTNLKLIFENEKIYLHISDVDYENLLNYMELLKTHIIIIIEMEKKSIVANFENLPPSKCLIEFSKGYYRPILLKKILFELTLFKLDFNKCEDRYVFARVYIIIGELLKHFFDVEDIEDKTNPVLKGLRNCIKIRNRLTHSNKNIKTGKKEDHIKISNIIKDIRNDFQQIIIPDPSNKKLMTLNFQFYYGEKFHKNIRSILKYLLDHRDKNQCNDDSESHVKLVISKITSEINLFKSFIEIMEINEDKKRYLLEYIVLIISEHMRHLESTCPEEYLITALMIKGMQSVKLCRNQGLAHDIFLFNFQSLSKIIDDDLLPAISHFHSWFQISEKETISPNKHLLNEVGLAYTKLGYYDMAVNHFKDALFYINHDETDEDGYQFQYTVSMNLAHTYLLFGKFKEAYEIYEPWLKTFEDTSSDSQYLRDKFACILINVAFSLERIGNYKEAIEICKKAEIISKYYLVKHTLAIVLYRNNQQSEAIKIMNEIRCNKESDCIAKFALEMSLAVVILDENEEETEKDDKIKDILVCIKTMEKLLRENMNKFKEYYNDQYIINEILIIDIKICFLIKYYSVNELFLTELNDLEENFNDIIYVLQGYLKSSESIGRLYFSFCNAYIQIFPYDNKQDEFIKKAMNYYKLGMIILQGSLQNTHSIILKQSEVKKRFKELFEKYEKRFSSDDIHVLENILR